MAERTEGREDQAPTEEQKKDILHYASDIRKFEIDKFWSRSTFFWGFIASAFVAYAVLYDKDKLASLFVASFGLICSVAWTFQNRGGKYWHEVWEQKIANVEKDVLGIGLFSSEEKIIPKGFWGSARFSVSKLAILLSDFTVLVWLALFGKSLVAVISNHDCLSGASATGIVGAIVTLCYIGLLFCCGRSGVSCFDKVSQRLWPRS